MVEPFVLRVPFNVKVCVLAATVRVTVWPLMVPVTGADPLLHTVGGPPLTGGKEIE
jgi:hypothetical protein